MSNDDPCRNSMSDCSETLTRLYEFIDHELASADQSTIRAHLDDCGYCLGAFDFEIELRRVVVERSRVDVPTDLKDRLRAAIESLGDAR